MEPDPDSPPTFWFQPPVATNRRRAPPIDPVVLIILIPILTLLFLFFFLPPFLSHTSHIIQSFKPGSVKSTWDSLNIFLVLFAILCGVLVRQNDDAPAPSTSDVSNGFVSSNGGQPSGQWVGFSDRKVVSGGLMRNSSSYPNLRQESVWENGENRNRFYDDFDLYSSPANRYHNNLSHRPETLYQQSPVSGGIHRRLSRSGADQVEISDEKEIFVDTFEVRPVTPEFREQPPVTTVPPPPPPPPPSAPSANSKRHSFRSVGKNVTETPPEIESDEVNKTRSYPRAPPPPPPPPPPEVRKQRSHHKHKKLERKVSDATKEIATAISSLYNQTKRKKKRKSRNISSSSESSPPSVHSIGSEIEHTQQTLAPPVLPPPPPPPPPPPKMFQNMFKKGGKHKRIHSVHSAPATNSRTVPPPPPPPPPPSSIFNNIFKSVSKSKRFHSHSVPPPPPTPPSSSITSASKTGTKSKRFSSITAAFSQPPPLPPPMTPPRYKVPAKSKQLSSTSKGKPPLPTKTSGYYEREEFLPSGSQSPLIPMPPPPPPFKVSAMKFEVRGDFVRIRSSHSSVCSSPDRDDVEFSSTMMGVDHGGDSIGPGLVLGSGPSFFPSPDVNAKAESFISRLKDEWRMEKKNYGK